jgi:hypothetical protein
MRRRAETALSRPEEADDSFDSRAVAREDGYILAFTKNGSIDVQNLESESCDAVVFIQRRRSHYFGSRPADLNFCNMAQQLVEVAGVNRWISISRIVCPHGTQELCAEFRVGFRPGTAIAIDGVGSVHSVTFVFDLHGSCLTRDASVRPRAAAGARATKSDHDAARRISTVTVRPFRSASAQSENHSGWRLA